MRGARRLSSLVLLLSALAISGSGLAKDLGVQGATFELVEVDLRAALRESLSRVDQQAIREDLTNSAKNYAASLPPAGLPKAEKTATSWVDLSIEVTEDVNVPVRGADGEYSWQVLHPKGTRVNPLEYVRAPERLLFFNAADAKEVAFAKAVMKKHKLLVLPMITGGNPEVLAKTWGRPVFWATPAQIARFQITHTPSLAGPGGGAYSKYFAVTRIKLPSPVNIIAKAWDGLPPVDSAKAAP